MSHIKLVGCRFTLLKIYIYVGDVIPTKSYRKEKGGGGGGGIVRGVSEVDWGEGKREKCIQGKWCGFGECF